jgi:hypothetical protein
VLLVLESAAAGPPPAATASGFPRIGNGVTDGPGAALGRLFVRLSTGDQDGGLPLDLLVTSNVVTVDPVTCSEPSPLPCGARGEGTAAASGNPSAMFGLLTKLKLAAAFYLPRGASLPGGGPAAGWSLEAAVEGTLYAGTDSEEGAPADLRLFAGEIARLLEWGTGDEHPSRRLYRDNTGTGILIGDKEALFFPGWMRGAVAARGADCVLVDLASSEVEAGSLSMSAKPVALIPDFERARAAGFPEGVFGRIEVNFTGLATASRIVPGAASNDVELRVPAVETQVRFIRGDCNGDLARFSPLPDVFTILHWNFSSGPEPPCLAACDADGDGKVTGVVSDAIYLLHHFFASGEPPPPPYPECGPEPEPSVASCREEPGC